MSEHDPVDELVAVMETLADWLDNVTYDAEYDTFWHEFEPDRLVRTTGENVAALAQILELTQVLFAEHRAAVQQINEFVGAMQVARDEATKGTKLIVANAGDMRKFIRE